MMGGIVEDAAALEASGCTERAAEVDVPLRVTASPSLARRKRSMSMQIDSELYRTLEALNTQGRPCLIYTDGGIYRVNGIEDLQPQEAQAAAVKVRCENGRVQHIVLSQIEAVVEQGGHVT